MSDSSVAVKKPMSKDMIFKIMLCVTYGVATVFLIKNIVGREMFGASVVGGSLVVFTVILFVMRTIKTKIEHQQFVVSMSLVFLVFIISVNSGQWYSDDFCLYLAVIGLSGLYLRPNYTFIQGVIADILLIIQYLIHPDKAENLNQFILCMAMFILASGMFYMAINRGRAFIEISQKRAEQSESLLNSLYTIGDELQKNFENSSERIENMQEANSRLEGNTKELEDGSEGIADGAREVATVCEDVQDKVQITENHIEALNGNVKKFETALIANRQNVEEMNEHMEVVDKTMREANEVFGILEEQMKEISEVTEQLSGISSSTTMLALNASIEAARAGQMGAGFAVVASKVQELAVDSNKCSDRVANVVRLMQEQIRRTTEQLKGSQSAINESIGTLDGLKEGFDGLTDKFGLLYSNIEEQNSNINQVDEIFGQLKSKVAEMSSYSDENRIAVESMTAAMDMYRDNIQMVIDDTKHVHQLSASMMSITKE